jgi:hypothetical protein
MTFPQLPSPIFHVNKEEAALRQIESAIMLWFQSEEPVSVHTLAVAGNDCYRAMARHKGGATALVKNWFDQQSNAARKAILHAQEFFKHGFKALTGRTSFSPLYGELLILEAASIHEELNGKMTWLMLAFTLRFCGENPHIVGGGNRDRVRDIIHAHSIHGIEVDELFKLNRRGFLAKIGPAINQNSSGGGSAHIESP